MKYFYQRFQIVSRFPLWGNYLRKVYDDAIHDALKLNPQCNFHRSEFTCLLCGVSGEITAREFIKFVLKINPAGRIIIIDIGQNQIKSVRRLVKEEFFGEKICIRRTNALDLGFIKDKSVDWIDTDGFFSFFDQKELLYLFQEWKRILRDDGFITFRELTSHGLLSGFVNKLRDRVSRLYLGIRLNIHRTNELYDDFEKMRYKFSHGRSPIPFLDRYCLVNTNQSDEPL